MGNCCCKSDDASEECTPVSLPVAKANPIININIEDQPGRVVGDSIDEVIRLFVQHDPLIEPFLNGIKYDLSPNNINCFLQRLWRVCYMKADINRDLLTDSKTDINEYHFNVPADAIQFQKWLIGYWCGELPEGKNLKDINHFVDMMKRTESVAIQLPALPEFQFPSYQDWIVSITQRIEGEKLKITQRIQREKLETRLQAIHKLLNRQPYP